MREGQNIQENVSDMDIKVEIKKRYTGQEDGKGRVAYILRSRNFYPLGDWLWLNERKCVVFELVARLEEGNCGSPISCLLLKTSKQSPITRMDLQE